jgi:hypothetical protein
LCHLLPVDYEKWGALVRLGNFGSLPNEEDNLISLNLQNPID